MCAERSAACVRWALKWDPDAFGLHLPRPTSASCYAFSHCPVQCALFSGPSYAPTFNSLEIPAHLCKALPTNIDYSLSVDSYRAHEGSYSEVNGAREPGERSTERSTQTR
ncbi:hypothetical protein RJT34_10160 [Clitoria ternatea]|uniref:Uncharacterized protein n=1 Tax=Clitoria ternatea TaxID=43366 RepID=A0AAN9PTP0_CLITE